jgi:Oligosaccharyltransferase 48 kDa subunit beta
VCGLQVVQALGAEVSAFSAMSGAPLADAPTLAGPELTLVAVAQAHNNARVAIAGSIDMFSNAFFQATVGQRCGMAGSPVPIAVACPGCAHLGHASVCRALFEAALGLQLCNPCRMLSKSVRH